MIDDPIERALRPRKLTTIAWLEEFNYKTARSLESRSFIVGRILRNANPGAINPALLAAELDLPQDVVVDAYWEQYKRK